MHILGRPFDAITAEDILRLCEERVPESVTHDYKARYDAVKSGMGRDRMLGSAAAFANTAGGIFVFGVTDDFRPLGIETSEDQLHRQLEQLLRSNLRPPLPALRSRELLLADDRRFVLIGVPRSAAAPHAVVEAADSYRFVRRAERQNLPMTIDELRAAFLERREWLSRARAFHLEAATSALQTQRVLAAVQPPGACVVHAVPLGYQDVRFDVVRQALRVCAEGIPGLTYSWERKRPNLEGYLRVESGSDSSPVAWIQEYRNGIIEMGATGNPLAGYWASGDPALDGTGIERAIVYFVVEMLAWARALSIGGELAVLATLSVPQPAYILAKGIQRPGVRIPPGTYTLPEVVFPMEEESVTSALRPLLDALWNIGAWTGSPHFDEAGTWHTR